MDFVQLMLDAQLTEEPVDLTMTADENEAEDTAHVQRETLKEEADSQSTKKKLTMEVRKCVSGNLPFLICSEL